MIQWGVVDPVMIHSVASDSLGAFIRSQRISNGRSIRQQAMLADINHTTLMRWEAGESRPTRNALAGLLKSFQLSENEAASLIDRFFREDLSQWSPASIRALRKHNGLSQIDLAEALQVNQGTVSKWESGAAAPSAIQIKELERVFGNPCEQAYAGCLETLRSEIVEADLSGCFDSYNRFWRTCSTHSVEYGEYWGIELTNRVRQLAQTDQDAARLLSWIYSSRAYWMLVRGRHQQVIDLASHSIRLGSQVGYDLTNSYAFWLAARVQFTKRAVSESDRLTLKRIARIAERKLVGTKLPFLNLVRAAEAAAVGDLRLTHRILDEIRPEHFDTSDQGQCGSWGTDYWRSVVAGYHKMFDLQARDFEAVLQRSSIDSRQPVANFLDRAYDLAALSKLSKQSRAAAYAGIAREAESQDLTFALSTIESHVRRISGIDLRSQCLGC